MNGPRRPWPEGKPTPAIVAVALVVAVAPLAVQAATLALTRSIPSTVLAGGLLAIAVIGAAIALMVRGPSARPGAGAVLSVVLAVATYHALAFVLAYVATSVWLGQPTSP